MDIALQPLAYACMHMPWCPLPEVTLISCMDICKGPEILPQCWTAQLVCSATVFTWR